MTLPAPAFFLKRAVIVLLLSVALVASTTAQAPSLTIGSVQACAAPEVLVPVTGAALQNIGAITLFIAFDSTQLTYKSIDNIDPQLEGIIYSLSSVPFRLGIVWSGIVPAQFMTKKLFDIRFAYHGNASNVSFLGDCEVSDMQLQILNIAFNNGMVNQGAPQVTLQPKDTIVQPWARASFHTDASGATEYLWTASTDHGQTWSALADNEIYQGAHSGQLTLAYAPPSFDQYRYACLVSSQNCTILSGFATLTVDTLASVRGLLQSDLPVTISPNPATDFSMIEYSLPGRGFVKLDVLDLTGNLVAGLESGTREKGPNSLRLDASLLPPGLYFCRLQFSGQQSGLIITRKFIIN